LLTCEKGSVENAIQHTQGTALRGRRFESIEEQNTFLMHWEENWASRRIHGSTKRQVQAMFEEEKPHLRALPVQPFRYFTESIRSVWDDTTVRVDNSSYAARPAPIGSTVLVRLYENTVEIRTTKPRRCSVPIRGRFAPERCCCPSPSARLTPRARPPSCSPRPN